MTQYNTDILHQNLQIAQLKLYCDLESTHQVDDLVEVHAEVDVYDAGRVTDGPDRLLVVRHQRPVEALLSRDSARDVGPTLCGQTRLLTRPLAIDAPSGYCNDTGY